MAGLVPAIAIPDALRGIEIPGTRPGMTGLLTRHTLHPKRLPRALRPTVSDLAMIIVAHRPAATSVSQFSVKS
jgi:hypothetical protein